jgi:hypothetical protein
MCLEYNLQHKEDTTTGYNSEEHVCSVILLLAVPRILVTPAAASSEHGEWLVGHIHLGHSQVPHRGVIAALQATHNPP